MNTIAKAKESQAPPRHLFPDNPESGGWWYVLGLLAWGVGLIGAPAAFKFWGVPACALPSLCALLAPGPIALASVLLGTALLMIGAGISVTGLRRGIMLGARNAFSLSRLQMVMWTWLVLSAILAAAAVRAWGLNGVPTPLDTTLSIALPGNLLAVLGIAVTSATVAPAILAVKTQGETDYKATPSLGRKLNGTAFIRGQVVYRAHRKEARLDDLIRGDDTGSAGAIDLAKVQNLMLTAILLACYLLMLFNLFASSTDFNLMDPKVMAGPFTSLPNFTNGMITFLAISHGGYLAYKASPKPDGTKDGLVGYAAPASTNGPPTPPAPSDPAKANDAAGQPQITPDKKTGGRTPRAPK